MSDKKKRLCLDVVNELWSFSQVPESIKTLIEPDPVKYMVAIVKAYAEQQANEAKTNQDNNDLLADVSDSTWKEKLEALIGGLEIENKEKLINDGDVDTYKMLGEVIASKIKQLKYWR